MVAIGPAVVRIFGMFDKIDDIVYEPVHLLCDALRQPLKQIEHSNEKDKASHAQELKKQLEIFESDLEIDKKEREMKLTLEQRRIEEEINQMVLDKDLVRREEMVKLEAKYRKEMAAAASELAQIMANIQADTRGKILTLYSEKEKEYLDLQAKYKKDLFDTVKSLQEIFHDGSGQDIIKDEITTQLKLITERSSKFSALLNEDMRNVFSIINTQMTDMSELAAKYFMPNSDKPALTQQVVDGQ